jgi:hypothetical protein
MNMLYYSEHLNDDYNSAHQLLVGVLSELFQYLRQHYTALSY